MTEHKQYGESYYTRMVLRRWDEVCEYYDKRWKSTNNDKKMAQLMSDIWIQLEPMMQGTEKQDTFNKYEEWAMEPQLMLLNEERLYGMFRMLRGAMDTLGLTRIEKVT